MEYRPTTMTDFRHVIANLSVQFLDELQRGNFTVDQVRQTMKSFIKQGNALTLTHNGAILAILGYIVVEGVIHTAFPSTPAFFQRDTSRFGKKLMRLVQAKEGNLPIISHSYTNDLKVARWYKIIGYRNIETTNTRNVYVLDPA